MLPQDYETSYDHAAYTYEEDEAQGQPESYTQR